MDLIKRTEELFGTSDLYMVLSVSASDAADKEKLRRAYRRAAFRYHPDKAQGDASATEKFQLLTKILELLQDDDTRKFYDETGKLPEDQTNYDPSKYSARLDVGMVELFRKEYIGSDEEKQDFIKHYNDGEGSLIYLFDQMYFVNPLDDLERVQKMIDDAIESGEVKKYSKPKGFDSKWKKYLNKVKKEAAEAEEMLTEIKEKYQLPKRQKRDAGSGDVSDLASMILARREQQEHSFLEQLEAKYSKKGSAKKKGNKSKN